MMRKKSLSVVSVNILTQKGSSSKSQHFIEIGEQGVIGNVQAGDFQCQVSLLSEESLVRFCSENNCHISAESLTGNILVQGMELSAIQLLDRFVADPIILEVTMMGNQFHKEECRSFRSTGDCIIDHKGIYCRVIQGGILKPGDTIRYEPRSLKIAVITLSTRAFSGIYEDKSGLTLQEILSDFFHKQQWRTSMKRSLIPDDIGLLNRELIDYFENGYDIIFTTGGTGIGPHDYTPEVVAEFCDKLIPGIMEFIRCKYGEKIPNALLSRSVAGIREKTLVYTLPGSVKAVREYLSEILKTIEHCLFMIHELDTHR